MSTERRLRRDNRLIAAELGTAEDGHPKWAWQWSDDLWFMIQEKDDAGAPRYDHIANPRTGLIELQPVYFKKPMAPHLRRQWVLCTWMPSPPEHVWRAQFGSLVPYIHGGYWAPTNVELAEGIEPWTVHRGESFTSLVVNMAKRQRAKKFKDFYDEGVEIVEKREKEKERILDDQLDDLKLPFANAPHVPGKRGGAVSTPYTGIDKVDSSTLAQSAPKE